MSEEIQKPKFIDYVNAYEFTCELPGSKKEVKFKPVNTAQLKRLLTYENETNFIVQENALDDLISSSVLSEDFNINDLYLQDRFFLLMELRKKSKGEDLEFTLKCPNCKSQSINRINLDRLPVTEKDDSINRTVELSNNIKVTVKNIKRKDQKQLKPGALRKGMSDILQYAELQTFYHAMAIESITTPDGTESDISLKDKKWFIDNIPTNEYDKIKDKIDDISFGLDLTYKMKCLHCGYEDETTIPLENNFFS